VLNDTPIDLSYRDYDYLEGRVRVAQGVSPGMAAHAEFSIASSTYTFNLQGSGQRDATQYSGLVGVAFGLNRLIHGEAASAISVAISKTLPIAGRKAQLQCLAGMEPDPPYHRQPRRGAHVPACADDGVAGIEEQGFTVTVVHELLRNLLLKPGGDIPATAIRAPIATTLTPMASSARHGWWTATGRSMQTSPTGSDAPDPAVAARQFDQSRGNVTLSYRF
jgi:hypothetical protein